MQCLFWFFLFAFRNNIRNKSNFWKSCGSSMISCICGVWFYFLQCVNASISKLDLSSRLRGITTEFGWFNPQSPLPSAFVLGWILIYQNSAQRRVARRTGVIFRLAFASVRLKYAKIFACSKLNVTWPNAKDLFAHAIYSAGFGKHDRCYLHDLPARGCSKARFYRSASDLYNFVLRYRG